MKNTKKKLYTGTAIEWGDIQNKSGKEEEVIAGRLRDEKNNKPTKEEIESTLELLKDIE